MSNIKNYTKSDLKLIHLLSSRGLDYEKSISIVNYEKELIHSNKNLTKIIKMFCDITSITIEEFRENRDRKTQHIKHVFIYYCTKNTSLKHEDIAGFLNITRTNVFSACKVIQNDIDIKETLTMSVLKEVNKLAQNTNK
tara:strand:- start:446 stop:862 length:417 start_codon:yes stop_codon:yes gene_type:complete